MKDFIIRNNWLAKKLFIFLFWIGIWKIIYLIVGRDIYVPSPFSVFAKLKEFIYLPVFWKTIGYSMYRVIVGVSLSLFFGIVIGILSAMNKHVYDLIRPLITIIKSTPVLSFIVIALIWFTSSNVPIFICFLMCFPIIWTNVITGIYSVDHQLIEMARIYYVSKSNIIKRVYLPSIRPYLSAACITSLGLGWKVSVAAEVLSHPRNAIGTNLHTAKVYLDSSELFAWTFVVIILSMLFEGIFSRFVTKKTKDLLI